MAGLADADSARPATRGAESKVRGNILMYFKSMREVGVRFVGIEVR